MNTTMLVLNIPVELEEDLVDYLLSLEGIAGFTSFRVQGHGEHSELSVAEQVTGRRTRLRYEIVLDQAGVSRVLQGLAEGVGSDIIYWQQPVTNFGRIG
jgi:nitrogen regulatory protein PII